MIVKVKVPGKPCSWFVVGEVSHVQYQDEPKMMPCKSRGQHNFIECEPKEGVDSLLTNTIYVYRGDEIISITFDTMAYLCSDKGETLEKIKGR